MTDPAAERQHSSFDLSIGGEPMLAQAESLTMTERFDASVSVPLPEMLEATTQAVAQMHGYEHDNLYPKPRFGEYNVAGRRFCDIFLTEYGPDVERRNRAVLVEWDEAFQDALGTMLGVAVLGDDTESFAWLQEAVDLVGFDSRRFGFEYLAAMYLSGSHRDGRIVDQLFSMLNEIPEEYQVSSRALLVKHFPERAFSLDSELNAGDDFSARIAAIKQMSPKEAFSQLKSEIEELGVPESADALTFDFFAKYVATLHLFRKAGEESFWRYGKRIESLAAVFATLPQRVVSDEDRRKLGTLAYVTGAVIGQGDVLRQIGSRLDWLYPQSGVPYASMRQKDSWLHGVGFLNDVRGLNARDFDELDDTAKRHYFYKLFEDDDTARMNMFASSLPEDFQLHGSYLALASPGGARSLGMGLNCREMPCIRRAYVYYDTIVNRMSQISQQDRRHVNAALTELEGIGSDDDIEVVAWHTLLASNISDTEKKEILEQIAATIDRVMFR